MTELDLAWTLPAPALLGIAAAAIGLLLILIIRLRLHAFVALVVVSVITALASGIRPADLVTVLYEGFGSTLASVALLVGLGAMLGRMLELSGGAEVLTDRLIGIFGEKRAPLALGVTSLLFGFPIFFDAGLVVMLPIIFTVARRLGGSLLLYAMPAAMAFSAMHIFVPPHPGPVAASGLLGADVGLVLICGSSSRSPRGTCAVTCTDCSSASASRCPYRRSSPPVRAPTSPISGPRRGWGPSSCSSSSRSSSSPSTPVSASPPKPGGSILSRRR